MARGLPERECSEIRPLAQLLLTMHAIQLTDLAFALARHAATQLALRHPACQESTYAYWLACRSRHDLWNEMLASHRRSSQSGSPIPPWVEIIPVLQEILVTEPLTRCVAHHALTMEEAVIDADFSAIAQSAFEAHLESRQRCLQQMVFGEGISMERSVQLNRLRRVCEQLGNFLLEMMHPIQATSAFHFSADWRPSALSRLPASISIGLLPPVQRFAIFAALRDQLEAELDCPQTPGSQIPSIKSKLNLYNQRVGASVMRLLPAAIFDAFGLPKSLRMAKFSQSSLGSDSAIESLNWPGPFAWASLTKSHPSCVGGNLRNSGGDNDRTKSLRRW